MASDRGLSAPSPIRRRRFSFWFLAALLLMMLFAASAPTPLYGIYQRLYGFSPLTLTAIYAVYAVGALAGLLFTGRLSDHLGRRAVVLPAVLIQISGMVVFLAAMGVEFLFVGRVLQGIATGVATAAISAWLVDLQPPARPWLGPLSGGVALLAGLAAGALGASLLVDFAPDPVHLVFWLLIVVYAIALVVLPLVPDPAPRRSGWRQSLRPQIGVPREARSLFTALAPSLVAAWALAAFYLSLVPSLTLNLLDTESRTPGGLVIAALPGAGVLAAVVARARDPLRVVTGSALLVISGAAVTLAGVAFDAAPALYLGTFVAGLGFGPTHAAVIRGLTPLAPADRRGALLGAIYFVGYFALSAPTIVAGVGVGAVGLQATTYAYGVAVIGLAGVTALLLARRLPSGVRTAPDAAETR